jgi:Skp family chaperone for outer membrane proteins
VKKLIALSTVLFLVSSCAAQSEGQDEQSKIVNTQQACAEYVRAYDEEANLDPFGKAVTKQLDNSELTTANIKMNSLLNQIKDDYPGLTSEDMNRSDYVAHVQSKYGSKGLNAMQTFAQMFQDVDKLVRELCDSLEMNITSSVP